MKTTRRGFFAAMLAPLLGRLMPKLHVGVDVAAGESRSVVSLYGFQESLNDGFNPSWDGSVYPTYGGIARNELGRRLAKTSRQIQSLELYKAGYLDKDTLLKALEIRMSNAELAMHEQLLKDIDLET